VPLCILRASWANAIARRRRPHRHSKLIDDSQTFQSLLPNCWRALHRMARDNDKSPQYSSSRAHSNSTVDRPFSETESCARKKSSRAPLVLPHNNSVRPLASQIFQLKFGGHKAIAFAYDLRVACRATLRSNLFGPSSTASSAALSCI
jgi:hypothetical protein